MKLSPACTICILILVSGGNSFAFSTRQPNKLTSVVCPDTFSSDLISVSSMLATKGYRRARGRRCCIVLFSKGLVSRVLVSRGMRHCITSEAWLSIGAQKQESKETIPYGSNDRTMQVITHQASAQGRFSYSPSFFRVPLFEWLFAVTTGEYYGD